MGLWVIVVPVIGGVVVGLMVLYGSKAIRGHGIPEAMEMILTNKSRIKPTITYLKPISSAIAIGTGGPFGAEGPIIATGAALGSTFGQILKITHNERKILLAAGATAGMSAIFGTPIAAVFLAIELLLFEFSPRSLIPVALACITGAAGHHVFFGQGPVFPVGHEIAIPGNSALFAYSMIGIVIGVLSVLTSKLVYLIEDGFEKMPVHFMWWPAIGGLAVGFFGYFSPRSLGVGYENITDVLSGNLPLQLVLSLCVFKFASWAIALGSGTSGGTLAPLLTIGGALGALLGSVIIGLFPQAGVTLSLAALVGMAAMFSGASRALLTSIVFALESTGQPNALLPVLAAGTGAYMISFIFMKNTIMTEKIARKGVKTPDSYEPDLLEKVIVEEIMEDNEVALSELNTIAEVRTWLAGETESTHRYFIVSNQEGAFKGIIARADLMSAHYDASQPVSALAKCRAGAISVEENLRTAVETMGLENVEVLAVNSPEDKIIGILSYHDILAIYQDRFEDDIRKNPNISLKRKGMKILLHGQKLFTTVKNKGRAE